MKSGTVTLCGKNLYSQYFYVYATSTGLPLKVNLIVSIEEAMINHRTPGAILNANIFYKCMGKPLRDFSCI